MSHLALLGGGRMGEALLRGLLAGGWAPESLTVAEVDPTRREALATAHPGIGVVPSPAWAVAGAEVVVVAVKPSHVVDALAQAEPHLEPEALVVSIAAGITVATLEAAAPGRPVVRAMPNLPAVVGRGATAIAGGAAATAAHLDRATEILSRVGVVVRVPESDLDAVTALSGSGPAYVFLVAEALIEAGVLAGLAQDDAEILVRQTLLGSAALLAEGDTVEHELRATVTSPGGTTEAGIEVLERAGLRAVIRDAVQAATERSRELGAAPGPDHPSRPPG